MYPILFRIGSYTVYSYTVCTALGILAGLWLATRLALTRALQPRHVLDAGFWALLGGVVGARAGYVISNWAYYRDHLDRAIQISEGGLSWHGALLGGLTAVSLWLVTQRLRSAQSPDWRDLFDAFAPGLALCSALGWVGCLLTGCGYGLEASGYNAPWSWFTAWLPDIYGVQAVRFLTQPLMIGWCLLLALALWTLRHRVPRGCTLAAAVFFYALADLGVAFVRGDGTWRTGLWLSQWMALAEMCAAVGLAIVLWARQRGTGALASKGGAGDAGDHPDH